MTSTTRPTEPSLTDGLIDLSKQPPLGEYLRSVWRRREFAWVVPLAELKAQKSNTVLGGLWHVLNPLMLVGVYFVLFGLLLEVDRGVDNFLAFLAVGVFTFHYSSRAILTGATAITRNTQLIRSIPFPRAILPLSAVVKESATFAPALAVMLSLAVVTGEVPDASWLLLVPVYAVQAVFTIGAVFLIARATSALLDLSLALPFAMRLVFYLSGVLYSVERFVPDPDLQRLFQLNPFYVFVSLARAAVLEEGHGPTGVLWLSAIGWATVMLTVGFTVFRRGESRYGRA